MNYLPLSNSILARYDRALYLVLSLWKYGGDKQFYTFDEYSNNYYHRVEITSGVRRKVELECAVSDSTMRRVLPLIESEVKLQNEYVVLMPVEVWERVVGFCRTLPARSRGSAVLLWCHLYLKAMSNHGAYSRGVFQLAADLKMDHTDISKKLHWFAEHGLLTYGGYRHGLGEELTRIYSMPQDLWTNAAKKLD